MEEQLISFETAKLAQEKGFKSIRYYYPSYSSDGLIHTVCYFNTSKPNAPCYNAITQNSLQKRLREEHQIIIDIQTDCTSNPKYVYSINVFKGNPRNLSEKEWGWYFHEQENWCLYYTYEDALEAGLQEALELINKDIEFK